MTGFDSLLICLKIRDIYTIFVVQKGANAKKDLSAMDFSAESQKEGNSCINRDNFWNNFE